MENLKLGQQIFVTTTSMDKSEVFKLHQTTIGDAIQYSHQKELTIVMGTDEHWGACPTRSRSQAVINKGDLNRIFDTQALAKEKLLQASRPDRYIYKCELKNRRLTIQNFAYNTTVKSLKDGEFKVYTSASMIGNWEIKIRDNKMPAGFFKKLDDAIAHAKELLLENIG